MKNAQLNNDDQYLYVNYLGLQLCIEQHVPIGRAVNAIRRETMGDERKPQTHVAVSPEEMEVILSLYDQGLSFSQIAKKMGHPNCNRVRNAIARYKKRMG